MWDGRDVVAHLGAIKNNFRAKGTLLDIYGRSPPTPPNVGRKRRCWTFRAIKNNCLGVMDVVGHLGAIQKIAGLRDVVGYFMGDKTKGGT